MHAAHRIEIDPNNKQKTYFRKAAGTARFSYNWALCEWKKDYESGLKPTDGKLRKKLNAIKKSDFPWMSDVTKNAPQEAIRDLGQAFKNFFQGQTAYPKPRKKGIDDKFSMTNDQFKIAGKKLWVPHLGWVKLKESFRFKGHALSATVSIQADRWYVSINIKADQVWDKKSKDWVAFPILRHTSASTGVDLGITTFATLASGKEYFGPKPHKALMSRIKRQSQSLSRTKKGSKNRFKAKIKLSKIHRRVGNIRSDSLHKTTSEIVKNHSIIGIEDLNVAGMLKNHKLARSISDMGFAEARRQITYKMKWQGESPVVAGPWYPSSKLCSSCGFRMKKLPLYIRTWTCPGCGVIHKRDVNAAINLEKLAVSSTVTACGASSVGGTFRAKRFKRSTSHGSMKQESNSESLRMI
ncbi:MAG: transposase [Proteobacteria bacterium]|nr:MAG: transposase [Pseudomonadota bacterium]